MHDGLVVVDKPAGWTSHDVVARMRRAYGQRRVGHAGTLDPDATGVLLVGLGRATRLLRFLQETTKAYRGRIVFGIATTTLDASGAVLDQQPMMLTRVEIERGTRGFLGDIEQLPPMVSAVQVGGRRLHELAREGKEVERAPRRVRVDRFDIEEFEPGAYPAATALVECSSGTYVRSLAADLGTTLGGCAHLASLRRLRVGSFGLDEAHPLDDVLDDPEPKVLPPAEAMRDLDRVTLDEEQARAVAHGMAFHCSAFAESTTDSQRELGAGPFGMVDANGVLLAVYERRGRGEAGGGARVRIVEELQELAAVSPVGSVVTIGVYDGVHLGHCAVLRLVRDLARARDMDAVCVTFDRHPAEVVRPQSAPPLLTDTEQKLDLLDASGYLDTCFVLHFDEARSRESAEDFVREVLVDGAQARLVVVGADFHFGRERGGSVPMLERMGAEHGFEVIGVGLEAGGDGTIYSSTSIRELLAAGDVAGAALQLGRPYELRGPVFDGDHRGRELGFPTANVAVPGRMCMPADGIYAGTLLAADGVERPAAISLGRRPTFYEHADMSLLEAFVLDWSGDLYGQIARVGFRTRLRGEERFESVDALVAQMHRDVAETRRLLS